MADTYTGVVLAVPPGVWQRQFTAVALVTWSAYAVQRLWHSPYTVDLAAAGSPPYRCELAGSGGIGIQFPRRSVLVASRFGSCAFGLACWAASISIVRLPVESIEDLPRLAGACRFWHAEVPIGLQLGWRSSICLTRSRRSR